MEIYLNKECTILFRNIDKTTYLKTLKNSFEVNNIDLFNQTIEILTFYNILLDIKDILDDILHVDNIHIILKLYKLIEDGILIGIDVATRRSMISKILPYLYSHLILRVGDLITIDDYEAVVITNPTTNNVLLFNKDLIKMSFEYFSSSLMFPVDFSLPDPLNLSYSFKKSILRINGIRWTEYLLQAGRDEFQSDILLNNIANEIEIWNFTEMDLNSDILDLAEELEIIGMSKLMVIYEVERFQNYLTQDPTALSQKLWRKRKNQVSDEKDMDDAPENSDDLEQFMIRCGFRPDASSKIVSNVFPEHFNLRPYYEWLDLFCVTRAHSNSTFLQPFLSWFNEGNPNIPKPPLHLPNRSDLSWSIIPSNVSESILTSDKSAANNFAAKYKGCWFHGTSSERARNKIMNEFDKSEFSHPGKRSDFDINGAMYLNPDFIDCLKWATGKKNVDDCSVIFVFRFDKNVDCGELCELYGESWFNLVSICRTKGRYLRDFNRLSIYGRSAGEYDSFFGAMSKYKKNSLEEDLTPEKRDGNYNQLAILTQPILTHFYTVTLVDMLILT